MNGNPSLNAQDQTVLHMYFKMNLVQWTSQKLKSSYRAKSTNDNTSKSVVEYDMFSLTYMEEQLAGIWEPEYKDVELTR